VKLCGSVEFLMPVAVAEKQHTVPQAFAAVCRCVQIVKVVGKSTGAVTVF